LATYAQQIGNSVFGYFQKISFISNVYFGALNEPPNKDELLNVLDLFKWFHHYNSFTHLSGNFIGRGLTTQYPTIIQNTGKATKLFRFSIGKLN